MSRIDRAARMYEGFMAKEPRTYEKIAIDDAYALVGRVHTIRYDTVENRKRVAYKHEFGGEMPHLLISGDGRSALILGGFVFTDRGFINRTKR